MTALIDHYLPVWDHNEIHDILIRTGPDPIYSGLCCLI